MHTAGPIDSYKPMLATGAGDIEMATLVGSHVFDEKLDGIRAVALAGNNFAIANRNGVDLTGMWPEIEAGLFIGVPSETVLDGEITAYSGSFQDIATRDRTRNRDRAAALMVETPALYTAFDVLHHPDHGDIRHWPWHKRRALLESLNLHGLDGIFTSRVSADPAFFDQIKALGGEGVVAKDINAKYTTGRAKHWIKCKATTTVSAIIIGYEPGSGARSECGAFRLAMVDPETMRGVYVGKVGSGLSVSQLATLKDAVDAGTTPIVEIKALGLTKESKLRQPVFMGIRTDLEVHQATTNQLDDIQEN